MAGVMLPGATKKGGQCMTTGPIDVCKVPAPPARPIPTPFPNTGMIANATQTSTKVMFENKEVVVEMSEIPHSLGDEDGVAGGVVSGMNMGPIVFKKGSSKVKVQGKNVVTITGATAHNGKNPNAPLGMVTVVANAKVLVSI
ncbi:MAG: DUF4150 domain-containing protein [Polyangiaceae bacterium]|jgi:hypothetical protein|nr:DUF4150 domain-containing protein [Polyangiaceae bacterium]